MHWEVWIHPSVRDWLHQLRVRDRKTSHGVGEAIQALQDGGPGLGRPLVDTLVGSTLRNLKELRPPSSGRTEVRILFAFDPKRKIVLLVAGDKSGDWSGWYRTAIQLAEARYAEYLKETES